MEELQLSDARACFTDRSEGELAVESLMHDVVNDATELMINNHLDRVAVPYTVRCVTSEILDFIHSAFVGQDTGEVRVDGWTGGGVANEIVVDSWARGALEVKTKVIEPKPSSLEPAASSLQSTRSTRRGVSMSQMSGINKSLRKHEKQESERGSAMDESLNRTKSFSTTKANARRKSEAAHMHTDETDPTAEVDPLAGMTQEEIDYTNKVKAETKKKNETKALSEKLTKQMEELKNAKDVIVDGPSGRVIAVKTFDTKTNNGAGGGRKIEPKYVVPNPYEVSPEPAKEAKGGNRRKSVGGPASRKNRKDGSEFVQEENQYGPMVEGVQPSGGVVVKEGDQTRRADLKVPKTKLTKMEFKKMVDTHVVQEAIDGGDGTPRRDPDNPSVSVLPAPTQKPGPTSPIAKPEAAQQRKSVVNPQVTSPTSQTGEFKTQKVAALPKKKVPSVHGHIAGQKDEEPKEQSSKEILREKLAAKQAIQQAEQRNNQIKALSGKKNVATSLKVENQHLLFDDDDM